MDINKKNRRAWGDMQGLGEDEIKMHEEIGLKIDPNQVDYIFTIGPLSQHIAKAARINFKKKTKLYPALIKPN